MYLEIPKNLTVHFYGLRAAMLFRCSVHSIKLPLHIMIFSQLIVVRLHIVPETQKPVTLNV